MVQNKTNGILFRGYKPKVKSTSKLKKLKSKEQKQLRDPIPLKVYEKLLKSVKLTSFTGKREYLVYSLLWALGLRVNELKNFYLHNWLDLIETSKTLIQEPKTQSSKEVVVSKDDRAHFQTLLWATGWFEQHKTAPLLRNSKGKPLDERYVIRAFNKKIKPFGEALNLKLRTHSFRIGLITKLLKTTDTLVVKDIIGHKSISTTLRYNRGTTPINRKIEALNRVSTEG